MEFREKLHELRERRGLSQNALAKQSDVPQPVVQRLEAGVRGVEGLTVGVARKLALTLGVSVDYLIGMYENDWHTRTRRTSRRKKPREPALEESGSPRLPQARQQMLVRQRQRQLDERQRQLDERQRQLAEWQEQLEDEWQLALDEWQQLPMDEQQQRLVEELRLKLEYERLNEQEQLEAERQLQQLAEWQQLPVAERQLQQLAEWQQLPVAERQQQLAEWQQLPVAEWQQQQLAEWQQQLAQEQQQLAEGRTAPHQMPLLPGIEASPDRTAQAIVETMGSEYAVRLVHELTARVQGAPAPQHAAPA
jgi:transcriptional regulator with XRE-family HTH domain